MALLQNTKNVGASKPYKDGTRSGYIWIAPAGTSLPAKYDEALNAAFAGLGYMSDDGLTEPAALSPGDNVQDAGGEQIFQYDPTFSKTWTGTAVESKNVDLLKAAFGSSNVTVDTTTGMVTYDESSISPEHHVIVVDELVRGKRVRHVMPDATFMITDDMSHVSTALVSYGFTITAYATDTYPAQRTFMEPDTVPKS